MASILLVDDEESPRATLALLLKQAGHDVVQVEGVLAAAEAHARGEPAGDDVTLLCVRNRAREPEAYPVRRPYAVSRSSTSSVCA